MSVFQHSFKNKEKIARFCGKLAVKALYEELALYPKPGLVSFIDNGAHHDMNGELLYKSLFGLRHYFVEISLQAINGYPPDQLAQIGKSAERTMNKITNDTNTHRGAIFSLGITCSTLAKLTAKKSTVSTDDLQKNIVNDWSDYLVTSHSSENTHGDTVRKQYGISGAKEMAIHGYRPVFDIFHLLRDPCYDHKTYFGVTAYQKLLLSLEDNNIIYRHGPKGLDYARECLQKICPSTDRDNAILETVTLHKLFTHKNISPGGVADMLSLLFFLRFIFSGIKP